MKRGKKFARHELILVRKRVVTEPPQDSEDQYVERAVRKAHKQQRHSLVVRRQGVVVKEVAWT